MPYQPSNSQVHVDRPLTNISIAYQQSATQFVAGRAAPTVSVAKKSDSYFQYNRADFYRDEMKKRAPATEFCWQRLEHHDRYLQCRGLGAAQGHP